MHQLISGLAVVVALTVVAPLAPGQRAAEAAIESGRSDCLEYAEPVQIRGPVDVAMANRPARYPYDLTGPDFAGSAAGGCYEYCDVALSSTRPGRRVLAADQVDDYAQPPLRFDAGDLRVAQPGIFTLRADCYWDGSGEMEQGVVVRWASTTFVTRQEGSGVLVTKSRRYDGERYRPARRARVVIERKNEGGWERIARGVANLRGFVVFKIQPPRGRWRALTVSTSRVAASVAPGFRR